MQHQKPLHYVVKFSRKLSNEDEVFVEFWVLSSRFFFLFACCIPFDLDNDFEIVVSSSRFLFVEEFFFFLLFRSLVSKPHIAHALTISFLNIGIFFSLLLFFFLFRLIGDLDERVLTLTLQFLLGICMHLHFVHVLLKTASGTRNPYFSATSNPLIM